MSTIAQQVSDFLATSAPFDSLDEAARDSLLIGAELIYLTQEKAADVKATSAALYLIQSGQYTVKDSFEPKRHVSDGDYFGIHGLLDRQTYPIDIVVESPGLVFKFAALRVAALFDNPHVLGFFQGLQRNDLQNQAALSSSSMWLYKPLGDVLEKLPISTDETTSIQDAAVLMLKHSVSSLLITQQETLVGIVTDRDLRNRVVAKGHDSRLSVSEIMTKAPVQITHQKTVFDALALMTEKNIHHLPIINKQTNAPIGMITATDIVRQQKGNVLFIMGALSKADSLYALTRLSWQLPHYLSSHAKRMGDFDIAGKVLSQATDIMTRKLITFFQQAHGKAPMMFAWLVYGSQAREDQTLGSDQDNGLLLAKSPNQTQAEYFRNMASYVCQGLAKCGIKLCNGNIMASNDALRLPLDKAIDEAKQWIASPTKSAIMHFNIFLDVRCAAGDIDLFRQLQQARQPLLKQSAFLAALARHTNDIAVPLSVFQKFVYEKDTQRKDTIDIKVKAIALVNNIARVYALAGGVQVPSTLARLAALPQQAGLAKKDADNLRDIWLFLNRLRWRHQLDNKATDSCVSIGSLSSIEKHQLKASLKAIERAKQAMVMKFSGGMG